jgi:triacylglycerol esterase/lipase EstA (alpha/beta hydrolase family)
MRTLERSSSRWVLSLAPETLAVIIRLGQLIESRRILKIQRSATGLLALLVACVCYGSVFAQAQPQPQALPFGPETYTRSRLLNDKLTRTFSVKDANGPFDLIVERGDSLTTKSIGAVIRLNGVKILTVSAELLKQKVIKGVTLQQQNTLIVDLSGDVGAAVIITISPPPRYTLFTNPDEPRLLRASLADGGMVEYFGDKTPAGMPKTLRSVSVSAPDGKTNTYVLDDQSRLAEVHSFNGLKINFEWQSETAAIVTATSADGKIKVTTPIDFSEGAANRVLASAPGCCNYVPENEQSKPKRSERENNHPLLGSASTFDPARWSINGNALASPDAVQACQITARALAPICEKIKWVLGPFSVPGAKKLLCFGLAGAAAASAYGIALVPAILASCEPILTGIQVACTAVIVIDKYDGCTRIKNFFTTVSTIAQNIINGGAPPRTPGYELIKVPNIDGKNDDDDGKRIPLILVHGIHGSDDTRDLTKRTEYWKAFIGKFYGDPVLKKIYALYAFQYYSDAEGVQNIAIHLGRKIDAQLADRQQVLLAHSMGGLVAKSYMVDYRHASGKWSGRSGGDKTRLLITLASPHHGTPGANDTDAIKQHMGLGWQPLFGSVNLIYWTKHNTFLAPPSLSSSKPNRSDLRWDNFDGNSPGSDVNSWLRSANGKFTAYSSKTITYGGALRPTTTSFTSVDAFKRLVRVASAGDHAQLEFTNDSMIYGLKDAFGFNRWHGPVRKCFALR